MSKRRIYLYCGIVVFVVMTWLFSNTGEDHEAFSETAKIALRETGHQLLYSNQDSTSLVLPIIALNKSKYQLSFEQELSFLPNVLVSIMDESIKKAALPEHYRVEVIQCSDQEVAYSYEITGSEESTIIPCAGRFLTQKCYTITVKFIGRSGFYFSTQTLLLILISLVLIFVLDYLNHKNKLVTTVEKTYEKYDAIGSFQFYPEQHKLVKQAVEISLSKKECELLAIFIASPNQIIKRDELTKKVWEDNGVFVGRSLDTYISKLRKKLKADDSIKLTNVHGVGYKLELNY